MGSLLIQEDEKKKRQLTLSSDATRRHNVRTFSCVNSLFKYLHRFICDSFFSLCVLFETVGQLESNRLGFFKEASLAASFASTATLSHCTFTEGNFPQQTCVADVALSGWEVSGIGLHYLIKSEEARRMHAVWAVIHSPLQINIQAGVYCRPQQFCFSLRKVIIQQRHQNPLLFQG